MTIIDPDRVAAGRQAKIDALLDSSAAMDDALTSVKGSIRGYEKSFRSFAEGLLSVPETDGLTYEALASEMSEENDQAKADGLQPPHRYTSAGALSTLESVGRLSAMGDLPEGYVWRRPKQSAPLLTGEKSVTDIIWKITFPGNKAVEVLKRWAQTQGVDASTLYGKRVVTQAISSSEDTEEAVGKLGAALVAINEACNKTLAAEHIAQSATVGPLGNDQAWSNELTRIEAAVAALASLKQPSDPREAHTRIEKIGQHLNKIVNDVLL